MDDEGQQKRLREAMEVWEREVLGPAVEGSGERRERFELSGGETLERLYTPLDTAGKEYLDEIGLPGSPPFTRGVYPTMHRGRFWTMRQYSGFGTARETNERFHFLLDRGQTGLSVAFDLPTQLGHDSDQQAVTGEVGRVGVAVDTIEDMETLLEGIPLEKVSVSMTINATAAVLLAFYLALARRRGVAWDDLRGTVQNDILKEYVARGNYIYPPGPSLRLTADLIEFCSGRVPRWNPISISGYHIREAGSSAVQEVAFTLAHARAYVRAVVERGLDVDRFAGRLSFFFNAHSRILEEVAKFRAARRLWARILRDEFGARDDRSLLLRFHAQTAGSTLTLQQPENNVVRVALQALAAVLGGCQSLHTNSRDEALALPSEEAATIALRTQQIIAHESGAADVVDALGGSWAVEAMTDQIEAGVRDYLARIDERGGVLACIEDGWIQREIHETAYRTQQRVEAREETVVGMNAFREEEREGASIPILRIDDSLERRQVERLRAFREARDTVEAARGCERVRKAAEGGENLVEVMVEAVDAGATLGEVADALRGVFGVHRSQAIL